MSVEVGSMCGGVDTPVGKAKALVAEGKLRRAQTILGDAPPACSTEATELRASIEKVLASGPHDRAGAEALLQRAIANRAKDEPGARRDLDIARTALEREVALKTEIFSVPSATVADIRGRWMLLDGAVYDVETGRMVIVPSGTMQLAHEHAIVTTPGADEFPTLSIVDLAGGELLETAVLHGELTLFDGDRAVLYQSPENTLVLYDVEKHDRTVISSGRPLVGDAFRGKYPSDDRPTRVLGSAVAWVTSGGGGDALHVRERRGAEVTITRGGPAISTIDVDATRIAVAWADGKIDVHDRTGKKLFGFDKANATAIGVKGDVVAWSDDTTVRSRDRAGRTGSAPVGETGCSPPRTLVVGSVDKVFGGAESGDITCDMVYDMRAHGAEQQGGENPGTWMQDGADDVELCQKAGGTSCESESGGPFLVRHDREAMVVVEGGAIIVDTKTGKTKSRLQADCLQGSLWFDATRFACVVKNRVEVFSRDTGASIAKGPEPGPHVLGGVPPFATREQAKTAIRCKIGTRLYPLDLCEDVAVDAGYLPRP